MAYQIEYHLQEIRHIKTKKHLPMWGKAALLALGFAAGHFAFILVQTALSGQWQETLEASEKMADALKNGVSIPSAVQTFCAELLS